MAAPVAASRSVLLVTGPGNSGEDLVAGLAERLGWVAADASPVHGVLLEEGGLDPDDARPQAWATPAEPDPRLVAWLEEQFSIGDRVVVSAPGAAVLLGHYLAAANRADARLAVVLMVRHPADAVASGSARGVVGWLNVLLGTERATRTLPRVVVQRDELLDDWQEVLTVVEKECGVLLLGAATLAQVEDAGGVVELGLPAAAPDWSTLQLPGWLRDLAARTYAAFASLADGLGDLDFVDSLRKEYAETYAVAEAMAAPGTRWARMEPAPAGPSGWFERIKRRLQR
jgi:hypothetical protein